MTIRASAYVSGSFNLFNYYYNSSANKTYATVNVSASWIGIPFFQLKDQLGIGMGAGDGNFIHQSSSSTATYRTSNGKTFTATTEKEIPLTIAVIFKFPMQKWSSSLNDAGTLVNISATFTAAVSNRVNLMSYRPCYAHQDVQIGGGIGLSLGAGVSLSFEVTRGFTREWYPNAKSASL